MNILNTLIPFPDEATISFVMRMAKRNGFVHVDDFYSECVSPSHQSLYSGYENTFSGDPSDMNGRLDLLIASLPEGHPLHDDPKSFFLDHSLFSLYSMFYEDEEIKKANLNYILYGKREEKHKRTTFIDRAARPVRFCKSCFKNDIENYGTPYIHRSHQIDGVCVCPIHGEPLYISTIVKDNNFFSNMEIVEGYFNSDTSQAFQYAVMCQRLLLNPIQTTAPVIEETITNTMKDLPFAIWSDQVNKEFYIEHMQYRDRRRFLCNAARDTGLIEGVSGFLRKAFTKGSADEPGSYVFSGYRSGKINYGLVMFFILYRTAEFTRQMILKKGRMTEEDKARVIVNILTNDYSIENVNVSSYNVNINLVHKTCGRIMNTTIRKFTNGDRCPYCKENYSIAEILERETDGLVKQYTNKNSFIVRGRRVLNVSEKVILQELYRPFLSPLLMFTQEERKEARATYKAKSIWNRDRDLIKKTLKNVDPRNSFFTMCNMYSEEEHRTIKKLLELYKNEIDSKKCALVMDMLLGGIVNGKKNQSAS